MIVSFDHESEDAPFRIEFNEFGFGPESKLQYWAAGSSSSFANPIAIGYFISVRNLLEKQYNRTFSTREILNAATRTGKHVAPARYSFLPICQMYSELCRFQKPFKDFISGDL